ncbi:unnamed protein product [Victoria cruziana]
MILKYSLLGNLLLLWMNIINLVLMVGLYYGFLTTFSMGPSYLLLLRTRVMKEGSKKKVSTTTAFIVGPFIVFISTYYLPLHLALSRPHTLTILVIPYILFHFLFFWNNKKSLFDYRSTHKNFIPNHSIQYVFLNNLIFQLFNHFVLSSSTLTRLVDISMFRYKNKILFLTSSFFGWLIGHMLLMKCIGLYLMSKWRNFVSQIFSIILFIICIYYLGRMPSPLITKKLKESAKGEVKKKTEEEGNVEIEIVSKTNKIEQEADGSVEEDLSISLEEEERWNLYKNIYEVEEIWLNGKEKDEFDLKEKEKSELLWIEKSLLEKLPAEAHSNEWVLTTKKQRNNLRNGFINRIKGIDKGSLIFDVFHDPLLNGPYRGTTKKWYLYSIRNYSTTSTRGSTKMTWINKIYDILFSKDYREFERELEHKIDKLDIKSSSIGIEDSSVTIGEFTKEAEKSRTHFKQFAFGEEEKVFNMVRADLNDKKINDHVIHSRRAKRVVIYIETDTDRDTNIINITIDNIINTNDNIINTTDNIINTTDNIINTTDNIINTNDNIINTTNNITNTTDSNQEKNSDDQVKNSNKKNGNRRGNGDQVEEHEIALIHYSQQSDFHRDLIKGDLENISNRCTLPPFFDRIDKTPLFSFDISRIMNLIFRNWIEEKSPKIKTYDYVGEGAKEKEKIEEEHEDKKGEYKRKEDKRQEEERIAIAEAWDNIILAHVIRSSILVTHSILRKYIVLPSLIIVKNIGCMLLFQFPEWYEDFSKWSREMHVKCTYNGLVNIRYSDNFYEIFHRKNIHGYPSYITNIYRINVQFFFDSTKKTLNGYTYNDEIKEKDTNEMNPNIIPFISTIRSLSTYTANISSDSNSPIYCDLSSLSQAYRTYSFIKDRIKDYFHDYFHTRGIFDSESKHKKLRNSGMSEWKNWLKSHYQYNLFHNKWSRLAPLKWRKKVNQHRMIKNNDSPKLGSYEEKDQLIHSGKKDYDKLGLLKSPNREKKIKKHYRYDLLSYKYLNHEDVKDSNIYGSPLQVNWHGEISNYNTHKYKSVYAITINDSLEDKYTIDRDQNLDRKYFELRITNFYLEIIWKLGLVRVSELSLIKKKLLRLGPIRKIFFFFISEFIKKSKQKAELDFFLKKYFIFQLRWGDSFNQRMAINIKVYCLLLRLMNPNEIAISSIQRGEMGLDVMLINKDLFIPELIKRGIFLIEPVLRVNGDNNNYDLLVPEHILSPSHHRELRIISRFNYRNKNLVNKNPVFYNRAKTNKQGFDKFVNRDKHFDTNTNNSLK